MLKPNLGAVVHYPKDVEKLHCNQEKLHCNQEHLLHLPLEHNDIDLGEII